MGENVIPKSTGQLIELGNEMHTGLDLFGEALGITQITPEAFQTVLTAFIDADNAFNLQRSTRQAASDNYQEKDATLAEFLAKVKGVLTGQFGFRWDNNWAQAGFINNSTQLPRTADERLALAGRLAAFYAAHSEYEVQSMGITGSAATYLKGQVQSAKQNLTAAAASLTTKNQDRDTAQAALVAMMRSLIKILDATLSKDDARWLQFGLNMPGANTTPGQPVNVSASLVEDGEIMVQCDQVALATRYRWRTLLVGEQESYQLAASTVEPMACLDGVMPGETVKIIVQAVNGGSQGVASEPVLFTMPATNAAKAPEAKAAKEHANGNGNGHANGTLLHSRI